MGSGGGRGYSEDTAQKIDSEVKRLIDTAYQTATELINANREKLNTIAAGLLEYETLDRVHIDQIMEDGEMKNPPSAPTPPDIPDDSSKTDEPPADGRDKDEGKDFPGDLAPAGA